MPQPLKPIPGFAREWERQRAESAPYRQAIIDGFDDIELRVSNGEPVAQILAGMGCRWSHMIRVTANDSALAARLKAAQAAGKAAHRINHRNRMARQNGAKHERNLAEMRRYESAFLHHVRAGNTIAKAAALAGASYTAVRHWLALDEGFRSRFKAAQCRYVDRPKLNVDLASRIIEAIEGGASAAQACRNERTLFGTFLQFLKQQPALWLRYDDAITANRQRHDAEMNRRIDNDDMLAIIDNAIPSRLDASARDDLRSQAVIAVLSGEARLDDVKEFIKQAMKAHVADERMHAPVDAAWVLDEMGDA